MFGLTSRAVDLRQWQENQAKTALEQYDEKVETMYRLDAKLRILGSQLQQYVKTEDGANRPVIYLCEPDKPKRRVPLNSIDIFKREKITPISREFKKTMEEVRTLHFHCRDQGLHVPKAVFTFLDHYGMISRAPVKPKPHHAAGTSTRSIGFRQTMTA